MRQRRVAGDTSPYTQADYGAYSPPSPITMTARHLFVDRVPTRC
jgi:hypothetical protein